MIIIIGVIYNKFVNKLQPISNLFTIISNEIYVVGSLSKSQLWSVQN